MPATERGEVWLADLGLVGKIRPVLILSVAPEDTDRALVVIVPHTTSVRGSRFEVQVDAPFLKAGAFDPQNLNTMSTSKLIRRLGCLSEPAFSSVVDSLQRWLGLI